VDYTLELVVVPVSDVDRAKAFYADKCGFVVDVDRQFTESFRVVQLTPPGSACSITIGPSILAEPGTGPLPGMQLCVTDIAAARAELAGRGVDISPVRHIEDGEWLDGPGGEFNSFAFFKDPDGNEWALQEKPASA
jgi:catechol 2,3-dioxygenase-like lactoylglutathione lyase family enzyme